MGEDGLNAPNPAGRAGLVRNIAGRCRQGQSILLFGGPKLGKTALLHQLGASLSTAGVPAESTPRTNRYVDLQDELSRTRFMKGKDADVDVLLLDNCDHLVGHYRPRSARLPDGRKNGHPSQSIVWAGGRAWREYVRGMEDMFPLVMAPMGVLLNKEAAAYVGEDMPPNDRDLILAYGGTHPYVLTVLKELAGKSLKTSAGESCLPDARNMLAPFFQQWVTEATEPVEQALLDALVRHNVPLSPRDAARAVGLPTVKSAADTLCYLGFIARWNLNEGARLHANCRLFNEWFLERTTG